MKHPEHDLYREWLYLEPDGLSAAEAARLERHLAGCAECAAERREIRALDRTLAEATVAVDDEFVERVMASLPPAGWEARHPRTWAAAAAAFLVTGGLGALLAALGRDAGSLPPLAGALTTVVELFRSAAVAGAGLLTGSWSGIGLVMERALEDSTGGFVVFAVMVLGLDLLFVRLLLRSRRPPAPERPAYFADERPRG